MHAGNSVTTPGGFLTAAIIVDGQEQPLWKRGDGYVYVAGVPGKKYAIRVTLHGGRGEVIIGVDGRHIREDEAADFEGNSGIVVTGNYDFDGYILSDKEGRAFTFADPNLSVAASATGETGNAGVIGIAAYREQPSWTRAGASPPAHDVWRGGAAEVSWESRAGAASASIGAASAGGPVLNSAPTLGTAMGDPTRHNLGRTDFTRAPGAPETMVIGYQTEQQLRAWGLMTPADPDPWPGKGRTGYSTWAQ